MSAARIKAVPNVDLPPVLRYLRPFTYSAACRASVNSSRVRTIGLAFMLLAFAAFSTNSGTSFTVMP